MNPEGHRERLFIQVHPRTEKAYLIHVCGGICRTKIECVGSLPFQATAVCGRVDLGRSLWVP